MSKGLSAAIICGSAILKVPQLLAIVRSGSVVGLSLLALYFEARGDIYICIYIESHAHCCVCFVAFSFAEGDAVCYSLTRPQHLRRKPPSTINPTPPQQQLVSGLGSVLYNVHAGNPFVAYGEVGAFAIDRRCQCRFCTR